MVRRQPRLGRRAAGEEALEDVAPRIWGEGIVDMEAEGEEDGAPGEVDDHGPREQSLGWVVS